MANSRASSASWRLRSPAEGVFAACAGDDFCDAASCDESLPSTVFTALTPTPGNTPLVGASLEVDVWVPATAATPKSIVVNFYEFVTL
jgi:hypothetical protein